MKLTAYGRREILLASTAAGLACAAVVAGAWAASWWVLAAAVVPLAGWVWTLSFFRDPQRRPPSGEALVSPADGRVSDITPVGEDSPLGRAGTRIGVFMSIFDVHVNRCPCDAAVVRVDYRRGAFLDARDTEAPERNEAAAIHLRHRRGDREYPVVVRQVAGIIARRIVTDVQPGESVARGRRIGMIKFSSRLELLVPAELVGQMLVEVGQRVRAGETPLLAPAEEADHGPSARH